LFLGFQGLGKFINPLIIRLVFFFAQHDGQLALILQSQQFLLKSVFQQRGVVRIQTAVSLVEFVAQGVDRLFVQSFQRGKLVAGIADAKGDRRVEIDAQQIADGIGDRYQKRRKVWLFGRSVEIDQNDIILVRIMKGHARSGAFQNFVQDIEQRNFDNVSLIVLETCFHLFIVVDLHDADQKVILPELQMLELDVVLEFCLAEEVIENITLQDPFVQSVFFRAFCRFTHLMA